MEERADPEAVLSGSKIASLSDSFHYIPNFITPEEEAYIISKVGKALFIRDSMAATSSIFVFDVWCSLAKAYDAYSSYSTTTIAK